jgi:hypothetical protein
MSKLTKRIRDAGGRTPWVPAALPAFLVLCVVLATACTPTYNWREIAVADGAVRANFPARVQTDTREIMLAGRSLRFSLTSARVGDGVFAVGHAPLPPELAGDVAGQRKLADGLLAALHQNLGAAPPTAPPPYGADIEVRGQAGGHPVWALARIWVRDNVLVEAVATGSEQGLPPAPAREFVQSVRLGGG